MIEISITRGEREGKKEILKKATTAFFFLSPVHQFKNNISGKISIQWRDRDQGNPAFFHPSNRLLPSLNFELPPWKRNEHPSSFLLFLCSKKKKTISQQRESARDDARRKDGGAITFLDIAPFFRSPFPPTNCFLTTRGATTIFDAHPLSLSCRIETNARSQTDF